MLRSAVKLISSTYQRVAIHPSKSILPLINQSNVFKFCDQQKKRAHQHSENNTNKSTQKEQKDNKPNPQQQQHVHGPGCSHGHHHHHGSQHEHQTTNINVKLSKLSFEQLIEINSQESLRYANMIVQQESKRFGKLQEQKITLNKNIQFYIKAQEQNRQKEKKLAENIQVYQEQAQLSERRAAKEVQESKSYAVTKIAKQLLQVADCIANCKKFANQAQNKNDKYIELIIDSQNVIKKILKEYEIEQFDPTNKQFDANFQQSLIQIPTPPGYKAGTVAMTMRTGYTIHGRLLRSARVGVFS